MQKRGLIYGRLKDMRLNPGRYSVTLALAEPGVNHFRVDDVMQFEIVPYDIYGTGQIPNPSQRLVFFEAEWYFSDK
jgi:lipopolysaccharide transport system ATP-binding protein